MNAGITGAPVRSASAASALVVAAGRLKKSTYTASGVWRCWSIRMATARFAASSCRTLRMAPCR